MTLRERIEQARREREAGAIVLPVARPPVVIPVRPDPQPTESPWVKRAREGTLPPSVR